MTLPSYDATWLDFTTPITDGMAYWPDNAPVHITRKLSIDQGDAANVTTLSMSAHTATHVDAPLHFLPNGSDAAALSLATLIGPARVVHIQHPQAITLAEIERLPIQPGARLLFRTHNSDSEWAQEPFKPDFVALAADAAAFLRGKGVVCVGVDYLSVGKADTHHILLGAGISVIEGLHLQQAEEGEYDMICLPLKIVGSDGAPARVIARKRTTQ